MNILTINLLSKKLYVSGTESDVRESNFLVRLDNDDAIQFTFSENKLEELTDLQSYIDSETSFQLIINTSIVKKSALMGLYKNEDNLRTYYCLENSSTSQRNYIMIISFGEVQPAKYAIQIESIWEITQ